MSGQIVSSTTSNLDEMPTGNALERNPALDGIRGLAVLGVVMFHSALPFSTTSPTTFEIWVSRGLFSGWLAVDLFFVLSGFLITGILLKTRNIENYLRNFFGRRSLRIFPLYFFSLILFLFVLPIGFLLSES